MNSVGDNGGETPGVAGGLRGSSIVCEPADTIEFRDDFLGESIGETPRSTRRGGVDMPFLISYG